MLIYKDLKLNDYSNRSNLLNGSKRQNIAGDLHKRGGLGETTLSIPLAIATPVLHTAAKEFSTEVFSLGFWACF